MLLFYCPWFCRERHNAGFKFYKVLSVIGSNRLSILHFLHDSYIWSPHICRHNDHKTGIVKFLGESFIFRFFTNAIFLMNGGWFFQLCLLFKLVSIMLSCLWFGHPLSWEQWIGAVSLHYIGSTFLLISEAWWYYLMSFVRSSCLAPCIRKTSWKKHRQSSLLRNKHKMVLLVLWKGFLNSFKSNFATLAASWSFCGTSLPMLKLFSEDSTKVEPFLWNPSCRSFDNWWNWNLGKRKKKKHLK